MVRVFEGDGGRLNAEISLVRLVEASGVRLVKRGAEQVGHCPFHEDEAASLVIAAADNTWRCTGACDTGGGVIDWVMKRNGVSRHHAIALLKEGQITEAPAAGPVKTSTVPQLPSPVTSAATDQALLLQVVGFYHDALKQNPEALAFLESKGLVHGELISRFRLGYANRTLGLRLPKKNRKAGEEIRSRLERLGLYRASGHEHFNGSLVVPIFDRDGQVVQIYGRKIGDNLRAGTPLDLQMSTAPRGVWNLDGLAASRGEVILTSSLIDAMTFWCAGLRNVTAAFGANGADGFCDDHIETFRVLDIKRVLIAYPRNEEGEQAANALAERLMAEGFAAYRVEFPKGFSPNGYALKLKPASKSLGLLVRKASWLGQGKAKAPTSVSINEMDADLGRMPEPPPAADVEDEPPFPPEPTTASPVPMPPVDEPVVAKSEQEVIMLFGDRRYRIRGWKKPLNPESLKINLLVQRGERFHVDTFDLYNAKARASFVKQAGIEIGEGEEPLKHDLGRVLLKVEALQDSEIVQALKRDDRPMLSDAEREEALDLLKAPDLMDRILADFATCGVVGEETNLMVAYLACVSRLLDRPLAVIMLTVAAISAFSGVVALGAPSRYAPLQEGETGSALPPLRGWIALGAIFLLLAAIVGAWVYLEPLARQAGDGPHTAGIAISLSLALQAIGGLTATAFAARIPWFAAVVSSIVVEFGLLFLLSRLPGSAAFITTAGAFGFIWLFLLPFLAPMSIEADPSRRTVMLLGGAQLLGSSVGPLIASTMVSDADSRGALLFGAAFLSAATVLVLGLRLSRRGWLQIRHG